MSRTGLAVIVHGDAKTVARLVRQPMPQGWELRPSAALSELDALLAEGAIDVLLVDPATAAAAAAADGARANDDCYRVVVAARGGAEAAIALVNAGACDGILAHPWQDEQLAALLARGQEVAQRRRDERAANEDLAERTALLERANRDLSLFVEERTRHLMAANHNLLEKQQELVRLETHGTVGQLVRGLAHELNNPLASILGYAQRLQRRLSTDAETVRRLEVILSEVDRCRTLVEQLRSFAAPLAEALVTCHCDQALKQACLRLGELGRHPPPCLNVGEVPSVLGGMRSLVRVFEQLVDNAILAGANTCWLSGSVVDGRVHIAFENDGATPDDTVMANATRPFFTIWAEQGHRGLGLSIAASLLREQGGTIALGLRDGQPGARVSIVMPMGSLTALRLKALPTVEGELPVLVVDDEPLIAELLHDCLTEHGCLAQTVASFAEAWELISRGPVRAVLADVHLPDGSGLDLLRRTVALRPELAGHVALVTGDSTGAGTDALVKETGLPALAKPFRLEQVHDLIQRLIDE